MSSSKRDVRNVTSQLLSDEKNESIFNMLGRGRMTLGTAVVQLHLAEDVNRQVWNVHSCGVVCFVKDNLKRAYFIRLYDPVNRQLSWEQEVHNQFKYNTPLGYFHTFEAHDCQAGLNFVSKDEAEQFKKIVEQKLMERQKKRRGPGPSAPSGSISLNKLVVNSNTEAVKAMEEHGKEKGNMKITEISIPTQFRHVSHVGWDPNTGLDMDRLDPEMKALYEQFGIVNL